MTGEKSHVVATELIESEKRKGKDGNVGEPASNVIAPCSHASYDCASEPSGAEMSLA